jgi:hypothetical protein
MRQRVIFSVRPEIKQNHLIFERACFQSMKQSGRLLWPLGGKPMVFVFAVVRPFYSSRNVLAGSIFAIFSVGTIVARSVTNTRVRTTEASVSAS